MSGRNVDISSCAVQATQTQPELPPGYSQEFACFVRNITQNLARAKESEINKAVQSFPSLVTGVVVSRQILAWTSVVRRMRGCQSVLPDSAVKVISVFAGDAGTKHCTFSSSSMRMRARVASASLTLELDKQVTTIVQGLVAKHVEPLADKGHLEMKAAIDLRSYPSWCQIASLEEFAPPVRNMRNGIDCVKAKLEEIGYDVTYHYVPERTGKNWAFTPEQHLLKLSWQ